MKILAIADAAPLEELSKIVSEEDIDIICTLGDLSSFYLKDLLRIKDVPKIGVYGNHCSGNYFEKLGIKDMHLKTFKYKGFLFGGFEGSVRYKESVYAKMYTQAEAIEIIKNFPYVDIMISHSPPYGINDELNDAAHTGFIALKNYVEETKPKFLLHGHTYPVIENEIIKYHETGIIYVYREKVIDLEAVDD